MKTLNNLKYLIIILLLSLNQVYAQPDRSSPPELEEPQPLKLPPIQEFNLSNGLKVVLMEKHDVPLVQINISVLAGRVNESKDKTGLATMCADMLDEGAGNLNALQLADAVDYLGAEISAGAGYHATEISLHTPLSKLDQSLQLLSDIVLHPSFPEKELERLRKNRLTTLMQWHDQPSAIASALFSESLFGKDHPYGRTSIGDENSIRSISINDIRKFHTTYFKSNNAFIVVVGDVTADSIKAKLEHVFGKWESGEIPEVKIPETDQVNERSILLVNKPGAAQSIIQIGRIGVPRDTEDYFSIVVMNTILGGSFASRLNQNLREEHGYTYGAGSYFSFLKEAGPMGARAAVQTDVTDSALVEFFRELNGIHEPIAEDEIERAKNYAALGFPRNFQTVSRIADELSEMVLYNLPKDYFNNYIDNILSVSKDQIMDAAEKYIVPGEFKIIVVGDREAIEAGIRKLNLGEIKILEIEDVLGRVPVTEESN